MAGNNYLLDTNIVVAILNQEPRVEKNLKSVITYISSIVLGELYFGAYKSGRTSDNLKRIETFVADYPVLNCDKATADQYGRIKLLLKNKGRPIPENDIWIAAIARQYNLTLVTRDEHFQAVDDLTIEKW